MDLIIDNEFKNIIRPLSPDEFNGLNNNILNNGYDDNLPIIIWNGIIIDGHNRYYICKQNNVEFTVKEKHFNNRLDVVNWMIDNQLDRRNIEKNERSYYIGKKYKEEKKELGGDRKSIMHNAQLKSTVQKMAEQNKVNPSTVQRAEKYADAVDTIVTNTGIQAVSKPF
jgi:ATP-dependent Lon protease